MATFGNDTGTTKTRSVEGIIRGGTFTLSVDGIATSITAYLQITTASKKCRCMIYRASDDALMGVTEEQVVAVSDGAVTFDFDYSLNLPADDYILCAWAEAGSGVAILWRDFSGSGTSCEDSEAYTSYPPDPRVDSAADATDLFRIYCTYTAGTATYFGRDTIGASVTTVEDVINGGIFTTPASAVQANSVTPFLKIQTSAADITVKCAIYKQSDLSLIAETVEITFPVASVGALQLWRAFSFASPPTLLASTDYVLAIWANATAGSVNIALTTTTGQGMETDSETYGTWPSTMADGTIASYYVSVFCDYTVVASSGARMLASTGVGT